MGKYSKRDREEITNKAYELSTKHGWSAKSSFEVAKSLFNIKNIIIGFGSLVILAFVIITFATDIFDELKYKIQMATHTCEDNLIPQSAEMDTELGEVTFTCSVCRKDGRAPIKPTERRRISDTEVFLGCEGRYFHYEAWKWELGGEEFENNEVRVFTMGEIVHEEPYVLEEGYPASCNTEGLSDTLACHRCHEVFQMGAPIPASHNYEIVGAYESDCKNAGYTGTKVCSGCGHSINGEEIAPQDHNYRLEGVGNPTCKNKGYTGDLVCSGCGEVKEYGEFIPEVDHYYIYRGINPKTGKHMYTCATCGREDPRDN